MTGTYIILGATGGIGSALSRALAAENARLLLGARRADPLLALGRDLGAETFPLDATQPEQVDALVQQGVERFGEINGIVNLVGSILLKPAHQTSDAEWAETIALNLTTAFVVVRAAGKHMRKSGGSVVLMSSATARTGFPNHEAIAAAKAGVIGLMQSAAATYASMGIRFNAIAPGLVETPLSAPVLENEANRKASTAMHPLNQIGQPSDVVPVISWLLHPASTWITGQVIGVDGGLATVRPRIRL